MSFIQIITLSVIQGITEFLPISSSGHLAILQVFWQLEEPPIAFDVILHFGTLGAILAVFYQEIKAILKNKNWKIIKLVIIGTIPVSVFGLLFKSTIENQFSSLKFIGFAFLITGLFLLLTKFIKTPNNELSLQAPGEPENMSEISWVDALIIGLAQTVALFPGISRSGMTIAAGLFRKLKPETAYEFSFLLAIAAILGAVILQIPNLTQQEQNNYFIYAFGALVAFLTGIISLKALPRILKQGKLFWFSPYLFILGLIILII
ncbi:MAG: undecaprenyl-diphosphate phosphatase [Candidatus Pacebacteria bacterium]|nr:undecaprenyl-diphosphate phosphatase [Candidatus Paceibacterota bacterium]